MTRVVIAGGHGKIALILERLTAQRGDSVAGFIRNPAHAADLEVAGAEPVVVDLENASVDEVAAHLRGADAVVFAAGAGPAASHARTWQPYCLRFRTRPAPPVRPSKSSAATPRSLTLSPRSTASIDSSQPSASDQGKRPWQWWIGRRRVRPSACRRESV
jgi:NAD(P)-dependent dehydrogenase (short-subunit alcohol dehydrogenase family)